MKIVLSSICLLLSILGRASGQNDTISNRMGLGIQLTQHQKDFGFGLHLTSPYFLYNKAALRLRGNVVFLEHLEDGEVTWTPYANVSLGLIGGAATIGQFMRVYGEGGLIALLPSEDFSSESLDLGGYGLFGFEFHMHPQSSYFLEVGGLGTGARANRVETRPIYSNGLLLNVGFRIQFRK